MANLPVPLLLLSSHLLLVNRWWWNRRIHRPRLFVQHDYVAHITDNPRYFRDVCHMELQEAQSLAGLLHVEPNLRGHFKLAEWDRFVIYLVCIAHAPTHTHIQSYVFWSATAVRDNLAHWVNRINTILQQHHGTHCTYTRDANSHLPQIIPTHSRKRSFFVFLDIAICGFQRPCLTLRSWSKVIGYVDGTHVKIQRPSTSEAEVAHYSEYKSTHTVLFLVVVDIRGKVVYCSPAYAPGRASEKALFSLCDVFIPPKVTI